MLILSIVISFLQGFTKLLGRESISFNIILPIGISFYTFTGMSYIIDVYRGKYKADKKILYYALFISFFPKLTAGPIVRGNNFFPQIKKYKGLVLQKFSVGIQIFVFGLFKKIVLADHLRIFVDDVILVSCNLIHGVFLL